MTVKRVIPFIDTEDRGAERIMRDTDLLAKQIGLSIWRLQRRVLSEMDLPKTLGITFGQFRLLHLLNMEADGIKVVRLAEQMEVKPSAITVMLDRMEPLGLVQREMNPYDRRAVIVSVTEKGRKTAEEGRRLSEQKLAGHLSVLTGEETRNLAEYLLKIEDGLS